MLSIADVTSQALDIELNEPFGIATGAQTLARNVLVTVTLSDGTIGIGEAAPFPAVNGETQASVLAALSDTRSAFLGLGATRWRVAARVAAEALSKTPTARAGFESALLDAYCRTTRQSLWTFFGGAQPTLTRDLTVPTGSPEHASQAAKRAWSEGFTTLKVKVGGVAFDHDRARLNAITSAAPEAALILDANASLSAEAAVELLAALGPQRARVQLFEQPTAKDDLDGLRRVRELGRVRVAADESAGSGADVLRLLETRAVDVVNVKIMKCGVVEALNMVAIAHAAGLGLMIGGMVESELAMTVSACLAAGLGGFDYVDLDTPWFMKNTPIEGGWDARGAALRLDHITLGHGATCLRS